MLKIKRPKSLPKNFKPSIVTFESSLFFTVDIETDENGDYILPLPDSLLADMGWQLDDVLNIERVKNQQALQINNLSYLKMKPSVFKRNLTSIMRNISNNNHPLKRVKIESKTPWIFILANEYNALTKDNTHYIND
ncbi:hypothetical protein [Catenovulum maritimum]|uniref:Uncharacterized protein n=1 Tax=Catenovulum maritimum TaxID=1513271 RepID=A0A0J8GVE7_9ALTE|nr:hypothetical protein [Catenovulum maritimum]KMT66760.1 hypothetical protein XM47_01140 [Catenovulum maritimum]